MKLILTTALALTLGSVTLANATESAADEDRGFVVNAEASDVLSDRAATLLTALAQEESGNGNGQIMLEGGEMFVSTKGAVNGTAAAIFAELRANEDAADK